MDELIKDAIVKCEKKIKLDAEIIIEIKNDEVKCSSVTKDGVEDRVRDKGKIRERMLSSTRFF